MSQDPPHRHPSADPADPRRISRREALRLGAGALASAAVAPGLFAGRLEGQAPTRAPLDLIHRAIPASGEEIPVIGMGTWQTFMVEDREEELAPLREVMRSFYELGGRVLDSSPMYDPAERVAGELAAELGRPSIELMQVHNLVDVDVHLETLQEWKEAGRFRYIGITNTSAQRYPAVEALLDDERIDFVQTNYSLAERQAAERILPAARERGVAVMVARPFGGGSLFPAVQGRDLPEWAADFDCTAWSQFFLKYIISHPAITCAIPATSNPQHLRENMGGGVGRLPDEATRRRMEELLDSF
jgi:aryl-alcohol dehydrogenase-like predicted oxidoreductase